MHVYTLNYLLLSLSIFLVHTGCMSLAWRVLCSCYRLLVNMRVIMAAAIAPTLAHTRMPDGADVKQSARRPIAMRQMMAGSKLSTGDHAHAIASRASNVLLRLQFTLASAVAAAVHLLPACLGLSSSLALFLSLHLLVSRRCARPCRDDRPRHGRRSAARRPGGPYAYDGEAGGGSTGAALGLGGHERNARFKFSC